MDFFPHDVRARADRKLERLIDVHGASGVGIFWTVIEMLYGESNHKMRISDCGIVARRLNAKPKMVESVVKDFDLFVIEGDFFYSSRVNREILAILEKSAKAKKSAEKRWNQKKADTVAMRSHDSSNANSNANRGDDNIGEVLEEEEVPKEGEGQTKNAPISSQENSETMTPQEIRQLKDKMAEYGLRGKSEPMEIAQVDMDALGRLYHKAAKEWPNRAGLQAEMERKILDQLSNAARKIGIDALVRAVEIEIEYCRLTNNPFPKKLINWLMDGDYKDAAALRQTDIDRHLAMVKLNLKPSGQDDSGYPGSFVLDLWEKLDVKGRIEYKTHLVGLGYKVTYGPLTKARDAKTGIVAFEKGGEKWPTIR